jgi:hypothetical protein
VVVIGNGAVSFAQAFAGKHAKTLPLYTDPSLKTYDALGARRGILSAVDPRVHLRAAAVLAKGFRQSATKGAALQQGGALGVTKDGAVWFRQISNHAGDHFRTEDVLAAHRSRAPG